MISVNLSSQHWNAKRRNKTTTPKSSSTSRQSTTAYLLFMLTLPNDGSQGVWRHLLATTAAALSLNRPLGLTGCPIVYGDSQRWKVAGAEWCGQDGWCHSAWGESRKGARMTEHADTAGWRAWYQTCLVTSMGCIWSADLRVELWEPSLPLQKHMAFVLSSTSFHPTHYHYCCNGELDKLLSSSTASSR